MAKLLSEKQGNLEVGKIHRQQILRGQKMHSRYKLIVLSISAEPKAKTRKKKTFFLCRLCGEHSRNQLLVS